MNLVTAREIEGPVDRPARLQDETCRIIYGEEFAAHHYSCFMSGDRGITTAPGLSAWETAKQAGLDMGLIEDCLELSPSERIRVHTVALVTAQELRRAMKEREDASTLASRKPSR